MSQDEERVNDARIEREPDGWSPSAPRMGGRHIPKLKLPDHLREVMWFLGQAGACRGRLQEQTGLVNITP
jgi:hypothetical protein